MGAGIGARIRDARRRYGMTQKELAKRIGMHQNSLCDIERGKRQPLANRIAQIAEVLHVSTDVLHGLREWDENGGFPPHFVAPHAPGSEGGVLLPGVGTDVSGYHIGPFLCTFFCWPPTRNSGS
jgi:transcriptional regulator with XRE-family HTH domain